MINEAIKAAQHNVDNLDPKKQEAMHNVSLALLHLAKAVQDIQKQLNDIQHRVRGLES